MRTLLVTSRGSRSRFENDFKDALLARPGFVRMNVEDGWMLPDLREYDAVIIWIAFKKLRARDVIDWCGFKGIRVMFDTDAFQDYGGWWGSPYKGEWSRVARQLEFDLLVVTGQSSHDQFSARGFDVEVIHKGIAGSRFNDLSMPRYGLASYGTPYLARSAMLRRVRNAGIKVDQFSTTYDDLNAELNNYQSILVCNMPGVVRLGVIGRMSQKVLPGVLVRTGVAPEPMAKNFEAAGAGCAVFMDYAPDLTSLGFIDGETAIVYYNFDELVDKINFWQARPGDLRAIGQAAEKLCQTRHTFAHRAAQFEEALQSRLGASVAITADDGHASAPQGRKQENRKN